MDRAVLRWTVGKARMIAGLIQAVSGTGPTCASIFDTVQFLDNRIRIIMTANFSRTALEALPPRFEGRIALYKTPAYVNRVRIFDIRVHNDLLSARHQAIETPGLHPAGSSSSQIAAHGSILFASATYWTAPYVGWQIFFDSAVIERVLDIVAALTAGQTYLDDYTTTAAPKGSRFSAIRTPGPCAQELFSYLHEQAFAELSKQNDIRTEP